jgi:hypothetical protein
MAKSISSARKKLRGRPRVDATPVNTRFPPDELQALDDWIARQDDEPSRPEAVRRMVQRQIASESGAAKPRRPVKRKDEPQ